MKTHSVQQEKFRTLFVRWLQKQPGVNEDDIILLLKDWGWDVGYAGHYVDRVNGLDETDQGPGEKYIRSILPWDKQTYITQARYIIGRGYDKTSISILNEVNPSGNRFKPKDKDLTSLLTRINQCGGNTEETRKLARVTAKLLPWSNPEQVCQQIMVVSPQPAGWVDIFRTEMESAQPPAWYRWLKRPIKIDPMDRPAPPMEDEVRIILMALRINESVVYDRFLGSMIWAKADPNWLVQAGDEFLDKDYITIQRQVNLALSPYQTKVTLASVRNVLKTVCREFYHDEPQAWLMSLPSWDKESRIKTLLENMNTCSDQLHQNMFFWWAAQIVNRIQKPGSQADYLLLLIGEQGDRKTSVLDRFGLNKWTGKVRLNELLRGNQNTVSRKLQGKVIVNIDEWGSIARKDQEAIKSFITDTFDEYDVKWQEKTEKGRRRFALSGTSNKGEVFTDPTGNRRYLPFTVNSYIQDSQLAKIEELWPLVVAEVVERLAAGEQCYPNAEQRKEIQLLQEQDYTEQTEVDTLIHSNLDELLIKRKVTAFTIWEVYSLTCQKTALNDRYESFLKDRALQHSVKEAIKTWRNTKGLVISNKMTTVRRKDGVSKHYVVEGVTKHTKIDDSQEYRDTMASNQLLDNAYN